ncbi:MAG TPA: hypothetical protein VLT59_10315, partial [Steroidobacteraceae bacterium]|nr:hypothetical protein [Steroidobacteraceae bacterium]
LNKAKANLKEINRYDYVSSRTAGGNVVPITNESDLLEQTLQARTGELNSVFVSPWGSVFGLRSTHGNWSFVLQRNASVLFKKVVAKPKFGPFGGGTKIVGPKAPKKKDPTAQVSDRFCVSVNLGHTQFYPGANVAVNHAHHSIRLY